MTEAEQFIIQKKSEGVQKEDQKSFAAADFRRV